MVDGFVLAVGITIKSPLEIKLPEVVIFPVTLNELSVPIDVMLGCAAVVTVAAVVADPDMLMVYEPDNLALGTVPDAILEPLRLVRPAPDPMN